MDGAPIVSSDHARQRMAQRNLSPGQIAYVLAHGTSIERTGVTFHVLRRRDIPLADLRRDACARLEGAVLLVARDETLVTAYRNRHAYRDIRKKHKARRRRASRDDWMPPL